MSLAFRLDLVRSEAPGAESKMSTFAWRVPGGRVSTMSVLRMYALLTAACTIGLVVIAALTGIPRR